MTRIPSPAFRRPGRSILRSALLGAALAATFGATHASAQRRGDVVGTAVGSGIALEVGAGRVIGLGRAAASVFAADPKIAEVRPASATSLFIFGVGAGRTTVAAMDAGGSPIAQYDVVVRPSSYAAQETSGALSREPGGSQVRTEPRNNGIMVGGTVASPAEAQRAFATARMSIIEKQKIDSQLSIRGGTQVNLHVRIAEMSRQLTRSMGIDWQSLGRLGQVSIASATSDFVAAATTGAATTTIKGLGKSNFETIIDALSQDQLIHVLAEPNLTAMSGESASFIVGGEFPIPVSQQNNAISVEFKQYGISLAFVPTILDDGQITLKVRPEVSEITNQGAVSLSSSSGSIQIPALTVRRAETTVTLGSGQSFAIAGLLQDSITQTGNGVPLIGDVPILGALFHADNYQRNETELVIMVTPYIVRPANSPNDIQLPTDGYKPPNDFERVVLLRQYGRTGASSGSLNTVPGSAGFVLQ